MSSTGSTGSVSSTGSTGSVSSTGSTGSGTGSVSSTGSVRSVYHSSVNFSSFNFIVYFAESLTFYPAWVNIFFGRGFDLENFLSPKIHL